MFLIISHEKDFDFIKKMEENWNEYKDDFESEDILLIKRIVLLKKKLRQKKEKGNSGHSARTIL